MRVKECLKVITCVLASVATRALSDALHLPGFYDLVGTYLMPELVKGRRGWLLTILVSVITPTILVLYYSPYLVAIWIYPIVAITYLVIRKYSRALGALVSSVTYSILWFVLYASLSHTYQYLPAMVFTRGFAVLTLSALASYLVASLTSTIGSRLGRELRASELAVTTAVLIVVTMASYGVVWIQEYSLASKFPEVQGFKLFRTHKMDLVWLPIGVKGVNTYYYPIDRFKRGSPGYQVWVGMYWVQGRFDPRDVGLVSQFAKWDQNFWLGIHGCPNPYTYVDLVKNVTTYNYHGIKAYLMYGGMVSRSDVKPYEEVVLRGFFITYYDPRTDHTAVIYACATKENYHKMISKLWEIVQSWEVGKVR